MTIQHINPPSLHSSPAFTQAIRVPAGYDTILIGGQNGVGADGQVVGPGLAEQTSQALANVAACLEEAGASLPNVVKWTIHVAEGAPFHEGFTAFMEIWPADAPPPVITVVVVAALAVPGALVEIEAVAAVKGTN